MKTRFAPSNTGLLHLGNTRTALVSYLMAKKNQGTFIIRIEDTDQARSDASWTDNILTTLGWLGVTSDEPIVFQMDNHASDKYAKEAKKLVSKGFAYYCKCTPQELKSMKAHQMMAKLRLGYNGQCKDHGHDKGVLRLNIKAVVENYGIPRVPINDLVLGHRHEDYRNLPDPVLLRADGTPTYLMANTTDDALSGVDLVTRGADLYPQTATQVLLYHALLGYSANYAHLPLMYNEFGNKLSKRSEDTKGILQYKAEGYLPDAIIQFALSLGNTSIPTDRALSFKEMIEAYDLNKTNNKATSFVEHKITHINRLHLRAMDNVKLSEILSTDYDLKVSAELVGLFKDRADTLVELADSIRFTIDALKSHMDELKQLAIDNFSAMSCKKFRRDVLGGTSTPPIELLATLVA